MQALLRAASGNLCSNSVLNCTRVHQHGSETCAGEAAMAQPLTCPHRGHRQGSTGLEAFMEKQSRSSPEFRASAVNRGTLRVPTYKGTGICRSVVEDPDMGEPTNMAHSGGGGGFEHRRTLRVPTYKVTGICRSVVEDPDMGEPTNMAHAGGGCGFEHRRTLRVPTYEAPEFVGRWSKTPTWMNQQTWPVQAGAVVLNIVGLCECRPTRLRFCRSAVKDPDMGERTNMAHSGGGCGFEHRRTLRVPTDEAPEFVGRWSKTPTWMNPQTWPVQAGRWF
jgi:hypothetical protein